VLPPSWLSSHTSLISVRWPHLVLLYASAQGKSWPQTAPDLPYARLVAKGKRKPFPLQNMWTPRKVSAWPSMDHMPSTQAHVHKARDQGPGSGRPKSGSSSRPRNRVLGWAAPPKDRKGGSDLHWKWIKVENCKEGANKSPQYQDVLFSWTISFILVPECPDESG
jgi:hypothetical protein